MMLPTHTLRLVSTALAFTVASCALTSPPDKPRARLSGRRVLVTGGGRGIGKAIALFCADEGATVAIFARSENEMAQVVEEGRSRYGANILAVSTDVTSESAVIESVDKVVTALGGIDLLVNNAGSSSPKGPSWEQDTDSFRALLDLNVVSVHSVSAAALRRTMLRQKDGDIINISSRAGKMGLAGMEPYVASKFALEGLTASMAADLKSHGIRVNSISPGMVDTRSFPKAPGRPGVRPAESVKEGFFAILESKGTGTYCHVDEYDEAVAAGQPQLALKPINEATFRAPVQTKEEV